MSPSWTVIAGGGLHDQPHRTTATARIRTHASNIRICRSGGRVLGSFSWRMVMRRPPSPWLLLGLLMISESVLQAQPFVTTRPVRLRQEPSTSSPVIRLLKPGERVTLLTESGSGNFYRVKTERSEEGWVDGRYLIPPWTPEADTLAFTEFATTAYPPCGGAHHFRWQEKTNLRQSGLTPRAASVGAVFRWAPLGLGQDLASWCAPRQGRELQAFDIAG